MHILHVVGARPNFMKMAPVLRALRATGARQTVVHTGQHYDVNMSAVFFEQLEIPEPDFNLDVGSGSHAQQTAEIMRRFEPVVLQQRPDVVLVYGDVNSTAAAALVCAKLATRVGHVEAGLRSFDRTMPEEINRLVTDQLADLLFTPSEDGNQHLLAEGVAKEKIHLVGNVMIDTLVHLLPKAQARWPVPLSIPEPLKSKQYGLVTLHRPSNVDDSSTLAPEIEALLDISRDLPLVFPVHPRTRPKLEALGTSRGGRLWLVDPLGYLEFLILQFHARVVITDSGGIQEETTYFGVPCLTMRENTERPITITMGTNLLVGHDMATLRREVANILAGRGKQGSNPPLWDGHASERIAAILTGARAAAKR